VTIVLDASALIAALLDEPGGALVEAVLDSALIGTVNLAEVAAALARDGNPDEEVRGIIATLKLSCVPPDEAMALDAGLLRSATDRAGLSLGDRFCLALARRLDAPVLTADRSWRKVADQVGVEVRTLR
jgi:PIN domain nuclease of toxin-antitoxin system